MDYMRRPGEMSLSVITSHDVRPFDTTIDVDPIPGLRQSPSGHTSQVARLRIANKLGLISPRILGGLIRVCDIALIVGLGIGIHFAYVTDAPSEPSLPYLTSVVATALLFTLILQSFKLYSIQALGDIVRQASRLCLGWTMAFIILIGVAFFTKISAEFSRVWLALWYAAGITSLISLRALLAMRIRSWRANGRFERRALIVGGGAAGEKLIRELEVRDTSDIHICGVFDDRSDDRISPLVAGYPKLGNIDALVAFARQTRIDLLIIALPLTAENRLLQILQKLWILPVDIRLAAHTQRLAFLPRTYSFLGNVPVIDIGDKPIDGRDLVIKWVFDKSVALLALVIFSPIMALVALAIKLNSKGPALFRQQRYGFNNELIEVIKFRSMYIDQADSKADRLVTKDDPRVTTVGRFIRRTSLDELPQLINVLRGDLSIVGPRPHALQAKAANRLYEQVVDGYFARHKVKPGITGWAQVKGWRGETDTTEKIQKRVECDLYYIENWSAFLDAYILFCTPFAVLNTDHAY